MKDFESENDYDREQPENLFKTGTYYYKTKS